MATNTPLKVGSSLLWSVLATAPLSATPSIPDAIWPVVRRQASAFIAEQRSAVLQEEIDRMHRIFEGLRVMFERGDRRVMPSASFFSDEPEEKAVRDAVVNQPELHEEALAAAPRRVSSASDHPTLFRAGRAYGVIPVGIARWTW